MLIIVLRRLFLYELELGRGLLEGITFLFFLLIFFIKLIKIIFIHSLKLAIRKVFIIVTSFSNHIALLIFQNTWLLDVSILIHCCILIGVNFIILFDCLGHLGLNPVFISHTEVGVI